MNDFGAVNLITDEMFINLEKKTQLTNLSTGINSKFV